MAKQRFPIAANLESTDGTLGRAEIRNGYAELAAAQEVKIYTRPSLSLAQGSFANFGQGAYYGPDNQLYVISGGTAYLPAGALTSTIAGTQSSNEGDPIFLAHNNYIYGIRRAVSTAAVFRAASPFSSFNTLGTASIAGGGPYSAVSWQGTLFVINSAGGIIQSADGTSWSAGASVGVSAARLAAYGGTMFAYQTILGDGLTYGYTLNGTAWTTAALVNTFGTLTNAVFGTHNGAVYAIGGTGTSEVLYTTNGGTWARYTTNGGFSGNTQSYYGNTLANFGGRIYTLSTGTDNHFDVWSSGDHGATWSNVGTLGTAASGEYFNVFTVSGRLFATINPSTTVYSLYELVSSGDISTLNPTQALSIPSGETVDYAYNDTTGDSFIKFTTQAYTISGGAFTVVSDAQYPATTVRGAVYLNGHLYVMEPDGTIWNSAEDDFTSWAGTDFITAEFEADGGVCLAKQGEYVIALGGFTTEAFYDAGNATGSPLSPVQSTPLTIGCVHANSVAQVENSLVWVAQQKGQGSTFNKGRFVVIMTGYGTYERISTPDVERVLDADTFSEVYASILTTSGHTFYVLTLVDTDATLVYDFTTKLWMRWDFATIGTAQAVTSITAAGQLATAIAAGHGYSDGDPVIITGGTGTFTSLNGTHNINVLNAGTFSYQFAGTLTGTCTTGTAQGYTWGRMDISASCYFSNGQIVQLRDTGDVYTLTQASTSDNGAPIDFRIRTRLWDGGNNAEKFMGYCEVLSDIATTTGLVRYTDDFSNYTKFKRVDLSLNRPRVKRGGSFTMRAVEFRHTSPVKVGISGLEADIEQGDG